MKKSLIFILSVLLVLSLLGCSCGTQSVSPTSSTSVTPTTTVTPTTATQHPSRFDGEKLTVFINGKPYIYIRHESGTGSLTRKDQLDHFITITHIEGVHWDVYSTEEHPDLSYVLVMSGTNSNWVYRLAEEQ